MKALKPLHKNNPLNPDLHVSENQDGELPGREDILLAKFSVQRDFVSGHKYFVLADMGDRLLATICITSTAYPNFNKMLAEMIVDGLEALKIESS